MSDNHLERDGWITRVLGIPLQSGAKRAKQPKLMPLWQQTRETIDQQVAAMQMALRSYRDADYDAIAKFGFNGLTGGRNTALMTALLEFDQAPTSETASRVRRAAESYAELLAPDSVLDDYDANPLGVPVRFRATLEQGLASLRAAITNRMGDVR